MHETLTWTARTVFVLAMVALSVVPENPGLHAQASAVTVRFEPASPAAAPDQAFTVQVMADLGMQMDPDGLAGYQFELVYDAGMLEILGIDDAGQLSGPNSRAVGQLGPVIDNVGGRTVFGAYSYKQTSPLDAGPAGTVALAQVTLKARQTGSTQLRLENVLMVDVESNAWPDPGAGRQVNIQSANISIQIPLDTPTITSTAPSSPSSTATMTPSLTVTPGETNTPVTTATATAMPAPSSTPTPTRTQTPVPTSSATETATMTPTSTATPTPTMSLSNTPTATLTPGQTVTLTPTPTSSPTVTTSPSPTMTATPPATAEAPAPEARRVYLPVVGRSWQAGAGPGSRAQSTSTPADLGPRFTCSDWCEPGPGPDIRRQVITADTAVGDWRAYVNDILVGVLLQESATRAVLEGPQGAHVRIEALHGGTWYVACDSVVECRLP